MVATAGIASAAYQLALDAADRRRFPLPGQLVDIGGRRIHLLAAGDGTPVVVIIPALGANALEWIRVQRAAAAETTVVVADRAGFGWSDPTPLSTMTFDSMADDLHAALAAARIEPPYAIAGQPLGGIIARRFQSRYPADVIDMLLRSSPLSSTTLTSIAASPKQPALTSSAMSRSLPGISTFLSAPSGAWVNPRCRDRG